MMVRIIRYVGNAFALTTTVYLAFILYPLNIFYTILFLLVAYDQLEDLLGISLGPGVLALADVFYEFMCCGVGAATAVFGYIYYNYFYAPFHLALILTGAIIVITSLYDIRQDFRALLARSESGKCAIRARKYWVRE